MGEILRFVLPKDKQPPHPEYGALLEDWVYEEDGIENKFLLYEKGMLTPNGYYPFEKCLNVVHSLTLYSTECVVNMYEFVFKDMDIPNFRIRASSETKNLNRPKFIKKCDNHAEFVTHIIRQMGRHHYHSYLLKNKEHEEEEE